MPHRDQIDNFLRINGISPAAPDEEIRSAMIAACWHENEVEVALTVLRGKTSPAQSADARREAAHQLYNTDVRIAQDDLSKLLGVEVHIPEHKISAVYFEDEEQHQRGIGESAIMIVVAAVAAAAVLGALMYMFNIQPFA